jgi:hypothetical protein
LRHQPLILMEEEVLLTTKENPTSPTQNPSSLTHYDIYICLQADCACHDGKNNNDDGMSTSKNNSEVGRFTGRVCNQAQDDKHRAHSWSFQIARGYHEGRKEHVKDSLESLSLQKESKLRMNCAELARRVQVCTRAKVNSIAEA